MRRPTKLQSFETIRRIGIPIESIIDVGVLTGTHELKTAFNDKKQLLIEPVVEWNDIIRKTYTGAGVDFLLVNAAASNTNGFMSLKISTVREGQQITHAQLTEDSSGPNIRTVPTRTVDSLVVETSLPAPYLLKIDVDGAEISILEGSRTALLDCSVVVIEANIRNFAERTGWLLGEGFELFDIVDICYYDGRLRQFDLIFVQSDMLNNLGLNMYKSKFDISKWEVFA